MKIPSVAEFTEQLLKDNPNKPLTTSQFGEEYRKVAGEAFTDEENQQRLDEFINTRSAIRKRATSSIPTAETPTPQPDGSKVPTPPTQVDTNAKGTGVVDESGMTPEEQDAYDQKAALAEATAAKYETFYNDLQKDTDVEIQTAVQNIMTTFNNRLKRMQEANAGIVANTKTAGLRNGQARYFTQNYEGTVGEALDDAADRISSIEADKASLIAQAKNTAYSNAKNKWSFFYDQMEKVKSLQDEKYDTIIEMQKLSRDLEDRALLNAKSKLDIQKDLISNLQDLSESGADMSDDDKQKYADVLGLSVDFVDGYIDAQKAISNSKKVDSQVESAGKIVDLLNKIPEGETIVLQDVDGNDIEYQGTKKGKTTIYKEFNKRTNVTTYVTLDEDGKVINTETISGAGTLAGPVSSAPKSTTTYTKAQKLKLEASLGPDWESANKNDQLEVLYPKEYIGGVPKSQATQIAKNLATQKGSDGYVSPDDYQLAKSDWVQAGGSAEEFDEEMEYLRNPDNSGYTKTSRGASGSY